MPSLWDQLFEAQVLLRKAEQAGDEAGVEQLHQRIGRIESQLPRD